MTENKSPQTIWRIFYVLFACAGIFMAIWALSFSFILLLITDSKLVEFFPIALFCCFPVIIWILYPLLDRRLEYESNKSFVIDSGTIDDIFRSKVTIECNIYLSVFSVAVVVGTIMLFCNGTENIDTLVIILLLTNYAVLTYYSYKKRIVPLIIISIIMIASCSPLVDIAIFEIIKRHQIILGIIIIFIGFLFVYTGIRIIYLQQKILKGTREFQPQIAYSIKIFEKFRKK
jgi:hypothetical protein